MYANRIKNILKENLNKEYSNSRVNSLSDFSKWCQDYLGLVDDIVNDVVVVYMGNRSLGDIMRSLAHELIHYQQKQNGKLQFDGTDGITGSDIENEANSVAGVIMREYGQNNPHIFESTLKTFQV